MAAVVGEGGDAGADDGLLTFRRRAPFGAGRAEGQAHQPGVAYGKLVIQKEVKWAVRCAMSRMAYPCLVFL